MTGAPREVSPAREDITPPPEKHAMGDAKPVQSTTSNESPPMYNEEEVVKEKKPWWKGFFVMGSVHQIVLAAVLAIAIGMAVNATVDEVPEAARAILGIPGDLWLRALKAVVLPLIVCSMILAVQRLRTMAADGAKLARWTIGWYVATTLFSVIISVIMTSQIWEPRFTEVGDDALKISDAQQEEFPDPGERPVHTVVVTLFQSFVADNIVRVLADNELLAVLIMSVVLGYLITDPDSTLLRLVGEIEKIITRIIAFLIKLAPIGVFFLILPNLMKLDIKEIGLNLGYLIGGTLTNMALHVFVVLPLLYFVVVRKNPYAYWLKISPAWITAWGSASSAATLPVTLRVAGERGVPQVVYKFAAPLGCLINMDGTAIYFPMAVVFLAATQGIKLDAVQYVLMILLSTLASIGTTPIPSSSLVLSIMIANSIDVPLTGMYAVVVAIDWFLDRFRTAINVSGDLFACAAVAKITGITDDEVDDANHAPGLRAEPSERV